MDTMQLHVARVSRTSRSLVPMKSEVGNEEAKSFASLIQENKKSIPACFTHPTPGHVGFPIITKTLTVRSINTNLQLGPWDRDCFQQCPWSPLCAFWRQPGFGGLKASKVCGAARAVGFFVLQLM